VGSASVVVRNAPRPAGGPWTGRWRLQGKVVDCNMSTKTIVEIGTPEELAERLARRAPSLARGRYRLVVQPEPDRQAAAAALEAVFRELDAIPDPENGGMTDDEAMAYADEAIKAARAGERAKPRT